MFPCMFKAIPMKCFQKPLQSISLGYFTINKYYLWTFDNTKQASSAAAETQCSYTKENIGFNVSLRAGGRNHLRINKNQTRKTQNSLQVRVRLQKTLLTIESDRSPVTWICSTTWGWKCCCTCDSWDVADKVWWWCHLLQKCLDVRGGVSRRERHWRIY